jgi:hypothetical protein
VAVEVPGSVETDVVVEVPGIVEAGVVEFFFEHELKKVRTRIVPIIL